MKAVNSILLFFLFSLTFTGYSQTAKEYYNRGLAKEELKDYSDAIADYSTAIEIDPKYAITYYFRGLAKLKLGQKDSGCLDFSKAGELGYSDAYEAIKKNCQ